MGRRPAIAPGDLALRLRARGPISATELAALSDVNPTTVTRTLSEMEGVVRLGQTRRTRYALRREIGSVGNSWPIFRIDARGQARRLGLLEAFHDRVWRVTWDEPAPAWANRFSDPEGLWEGFPFFLGDIRPQGFLGRLAARGASRHLQVPEDPRDWEDDHTLIYLVHAGTDVPGDIVLDEDCLRDALNLGVSPHHPLRPGEVEFRYPELAEGIAALPQPGSSAGGEHPKFLATLIEPDESQRPVLVKFSPPLSQDLGRRWADLLVMEWHALDLLSGIGLAEPGARLLDAGERRFLEVPRFDRSTQGGRTGVVSLGALHGSAIGSMRTDWVSRVTELAEEGFVSESALRDTRRLQAFGELIGNTDMHAGNLAFRLTDALPFELTPAYDMLPMIWAPSPQGELVERSFEPRPPLPGSAEAWREMLGLARDYWQRVTADLRISESSRNRASAAGIYLERLASRFAES